AVHGRRREREQRLAEIAVQVHAVHMRGIRGADYADGDLPYRGARRREHLAAEVEERTGFAARQELRHGDFVAAAPQHHVRLTRIEAARHGGELHARAAEHERLTAADENVRRAVRLHDRLDVDEL